MLGVPASRNTLRGNVRAGQIGPLIAVATRRPLVGRAVESSCVRLGFGRPGLPGTQPSVAQPLVLVVDIADNGDRGLIESMAPPAGTVGAVRRVLICDDGSRAAMTALLVDNRGRGDTVDAVICVHDQPVELDRALQHAVAGEAYVSSGAARLLFDLFRSEHSSPRRTRVVRLTAREAEVARHLAQGATAKGTATALGISQKTVEAHRSTVFRKLGVGTAAEVAAVVLSDPSLVGGLR
jgi:DNA-binding NarL/FixJ family response regulator